MKSTAFRFFPGDILYGRLRPYLNKVYLADIEGLCSSEFIVLPPSATVIPKFLAYRLRQSSFVEFANHQNQGDRPRVKFDQIAPFKIFLPHKKEQSLIVGKLDELLSKVDACQERLERIPLILKRLRMAVLTAACSGRLTEDWRKRVSATASVTEGIEPKDSLGVELPESWREAYLGQVLQGLKYGTARRCGYSKKGVPVLRIPNIKNGVVDCSDLKYAVLSKHELRELVLQSGDILLVRSNGSVSLVGRVAVVEAAEKGFAYAGYLMRLRPDTDVIDSKYLAFALRIPSTRMQIEMPARSTSGVHNINSSEVRKLVFPLPPKREQVEIVRRVEALFRLADQIESRYRVAKASGGQLTQSVLAKAFRGELVRHDLKKVSVAIELEEAAERTRRTSRGAKLLRSTNLIVNARSS